MTAAASGTFPGVLFTNERGQVIFADSQLCNITRRTGTWFISWEPLHQFLGLDPEAATHMLTSIGQTGQVADQPLEIRDVAGRPVPVVYTGVAVYDDEGEFVGTDIKLWVRQAHPASGGGLPAVERAQVSAEAEPVDDVHLVPAYFEAQLGGLQTLLTRMGGERFAATLERIVNEAAQRNAWEIRLEAGQVESEFDRPWPLVYQGLLAKAVSYAIRLFGEQMVAGQMQRVDDQMDAETLEQASRSGLRNFFDTP